jgi:holo-[acyl-carrier protein] synthase
VILGAGIDLVEIARVDDALARRGERFAARVYTPAERLACERAASPARQYALRFAAKEAGMKALGTGWAKGVAWQDFEVLETARGLDLKLHGRARQLAAERGLHAAWLGASLSRTHALAQVVLEGAGTPERP